jgi:hypothetical protein
MLYLYILQSANEHAPQDVHEIAKLVPRVLAKPYSVSNSMYRTSRDVTPHGFRMVTLSVDDCAAKLDAAITHQINVRA